ncbi:MAG: hypothetical protein ACP5R4_02965 [Armatimonadota bacterium]
MNSVNALPLKRLALTFDILHLTAEEEKPFAHFPSLGSQAMENGLPSSRSERKAFDEKRYWEKRGQGEKKAKNSIDHQK